MPTRSRGIMLYRTGGYDSCGIGKFAEGYHNGISMSENAYLRYLGVHPDSKMHQNINQRLPGGFIPRKIFGFLANNKIKWSAATGDTKGDYKDKKFEKQLNKEWNEPDMPARRKDGTLYDMENGLDV